MIMIFELFKSYFEFFEEIIIISYDCYLNVCPIKYGGV